MRGSRRTSCAAGPQRAPEPAVPGQQPAPPSHTHKSPSARLHQALGSAWGVSSEWTVAGCPRALGLRQGAPGPSSDAGSFLEEASPCLPSPLTGWDTCPWRLRRAQPRNSGHLGTVCPHGCEHKQMGRAFLGLKGPQHLIILKLHPKHLGSLK